MVYQAYGGMNNSASSSGDQNRKIFLGGLSYHTTDDTLTAFCSRFGKITDCLVMKNPEGKSRGFGFVTYEDTSSVEEFMRARPHTIDDRQIDPKRAMPREEQNSSEAHLTVKKLFVAGLREGINEEDLRKHFTRYGNVIEVLIMKDREGKPRGFAFVTFDDYDAVDKAVLEKPHMVNGRPLDVKKAVPKEKMQEDGGRGAAGGGMSSYNRGKPSNYSNPNAGPSSSMPPNPRHNYGSMRDNYNSDGGGGSWDNQGGMSRMNNPNTSYNQPPSSVYDQQGGYSSNVSGYNSQMPSSNLYSQAYNSMGQNQAAPVPPPSSLSQSQQQPPMMSYDMYSNPSSMPYNPNPNPVPPPNYMQPPVQSYGQNQQQNYGSNPSAYNNMNSPFNLPPPPTAAATSGGYGNLPSSSAPYDSSSSYGITAQTYGGAASGGNPSGSYNSMPSQQSRGGGPIRGGRGGGNGNYGGPSNNEGGSYGSRPAPYPPRGGGRGGRGGNMGGGPNNYGGRGRGRSH